MFLEAEGTDFLKRFKEATTDLHKEINKQNSRLIDHLTSSTLDLEINTQTMIDNLSYEISEVVQDVKSQTKVLEAHTESFVETLQQETSDIKEQLESQDIAKLLKQINDNIIRTAWKSNRILEHLGLEDPEITYERNMFKGYLQAMKNISNKNSTEVSNDFFEDMYNMSNRIIKDNYTINDIKSWFDEMKPTN
ncbi:hypothetical protein ASU33_16515 [Solirubrum puertoriconensis]|uniref:Uncharacterized protein n=2 Tax=Solirubrum puertoriconensis TaxID=1751427 RepID=A0A9X0L613_SOLP1|nr:hypothetical protein ASU33_16515 [Solirubrum puertoriconensis]